MLKLGALPVLQHYVEKRPGRLAQYHAAATVTKHQYPCMPG